MVRSSPRRSAPLAAGIRFVAAFAAVVSPLLSEEAPERSKLTVERIFGGRELAAETWGPARWLEDGSGYTTLEPSESVDGARDIVRYEPESGRREVIVPARSLVPPGGSKPLAIDDYSWSLDAGKVLVFTESKRVWRRNTRGDYWVFDRASEKLRKLGGGAEASSLMFAKFAPGGDKVAWVLRNDLHVQDVETLEIVRLTADGSDTTINGTSDWVNEEELDLRDAFRWSPDGRSIAYWQFDTTGVGDYSLVNNTAGLYPRITTFKYPKVGQTNSACRLGVVASSGGPTRWLESSPDPRNHYIPEMEWVPDSSAIVFQQLNRLQNRNAVMLGDVVTGGTREILLDRDDAWVDVVDDWRWIEGGRRFLWLSERDGWRRLYAVRRESGRIRPLTTGPFDVTGVAGVDAGRGWIYLMASPDDPTRRSLYRVPIRGRRELVRVTPEEQPGTHAYEMSGDCRWALHTWSRFGQPPVVDLVRLPEHEVVRVLADNSKLKAKLGDLEACPSELFRVDIGDGVELDAWCIRPPDFDPERRYPLLVHVYGEPAGQTVLDRWGGDTYLWHLMLAQRGYLVMSFDNRGTPAPRGRGWRKCIYRQIGILASADQAAAVREILKTRPYVDPKRIGIWGWSGGGSMSLNAIFRHPDLYRTAMAIAFISDQRLYDTIYQERYMGLPADNEEGYRNGSPITFAHRLEGNLLLVHGTGDDNCHYQSCEVLIDELVKHGKQFSMMAYPNRTHGLGEGENTRRHLFETLTRFLRDNLPAGPGG